MSYSTESITLDKKSELAHAVLPETHRAPNEIIYVSAVIPCFNEERFISKVLHHLASQYNPDHYEILVVDGGSTDDTRKAITEFATRNPAVRVRIVDNPARNIPTALNLGIRAAVGEIIVRMDAHSIPSAGYVRRCVELLTEGEVSVVGMPWRIKPGADSLMARAIALAVAHPFGIGDAKYRLTNATTQFVDTVPFGAFKKRLWEELGGFDEGLLANEDYDFNYRVRRRGGQVLLDSTAHSDYFARASLRELATQYFRYGRWKAQMVKLHPRSIKLRHWAAPAFVAYLLLTVVLGLLWPRMLWLLLPVLALYALLSFVFSLRLAWKAGDWKLTAVIPLVFFVVHCAWGSSFLVGLLRRLRP
ncbi:MAG: glycosyltransferase family 2 protein [Pyrinomonadaceae bacterium]|nr:glycosyltransferase family 2 protein [Pyrinomonadaceae bacterium]